MELIMDGTLMRQLPRPPDSAEPAAEVISGLLAWLTCAGATQIQTYPVTSKALSYSRRPARSMDGEKRRPVATAEHPQVTGRNGQQGTLPPPAGGTRDPHVHREEPNVG